MFGQDRNALRKVYHDVWAKMQTGQPLTSLENIVADVIAHHPEYHADLALPFFAERDYPVEHGATNPYLHMGLHISIREQVYTDRPAGIREIYQQLLIKTGDPLEAEHQMLACLAESIWQAQREQTQPDETAYLEALKRLNN